MNYRTHEFCHIEVKKTDDITTCPYKVLLDGKALKLSIVSKIFQIKVLCWMYEP